MGMKLRIARKLVKAIGTDREFAYTGAQLNKALDRIERTRRSRENRAFVYAMLDRMGPLGRADLLMRLGAAGQAFDVLMRTPEAEWVGRACGGER